jgi:acyl carrier protein
MKQSLETRVMAVIARSQKLPLESIHTESTWEQLGIDSLGGLELMFEFEAEFGVDIPDDAARRMGSVRDVVEALRPMVAPGAAA